MSDARPGAGGDGHRPLHGSPTAEWRICTLCQIIPEGAAEILLLPTSTLSNLLQGHYAGAGTPSAAITLGVDDSYCKGRKFATLVYDLDRARVLWVGPGKGRDTIDRFFNDCLTRGRKRALPGPVAT